MFKVLSEEELHTIRRAALFADYERIDRVLSLRRVRLRYNTVSSNIAFTTPDLTIVMGPEVAGDLSTVEGIIRLTGANYHELSHVLYTFNTVLPEDLSKKARKDFGQFGYDIWNMLEDQRIEKLFLKKFKPTTPYFVSILTRWILTSNESKWANAYPLVVGRTYLDKSLRDKIRARYEAKNDKSKAAAIRRHVLEFVNIGEMDGMLAFDTGYKCVQELVSLLTDDEACSPFHHLRVANEDNDDDDDDTVSIPVDGLGKALVDSRNAAEADEELNREVSNRLETMRKRITLKDKQSLKVRSLGSIPVEPETFNAMRRSAAHYRNILMDEDPGIVTHQSAGKVNMKRAMHDVDYDTAHDIWKEGQQDATDMEVVIIADCSGSMEKVIRRTSQTLWSIQRAIESVSETSTVTAIGFHSDSFYLAARGRRVSRTEAHLLKAEKYTEPLTALKEAQLIFATSQHKKGLLFILTDGRWDTSEVAESEAIIRTFNRAGVTTALAFLVDPDWWTRNYNHTAPAEKEARHDVQVFTEIDQIEALVPFARSVVGQVMKRK